MGKETPNGAETTPTILPPQQLGKIARVSAPEAVRKAEKVYEVYGLTAVDLHLALEAAGHKVGMGVPLGGGAATTLSGWDLFGLFDQPSKGKPGVLERKINLTQLGLHCIEGDSAARQQAALNCPAYAAFAAEYPDPKVATLSLVKRFFLVRGYTQAKATRAAALLLETWTWAFRETPDGTRASILEMLRTEPPATESPATETPAETPAVTESTPDVKVSGDPDDQDKDMVLAEGEDKHVIPARDCGGKFRFLVPEGATSADYEDFKQYFEIFIAPRPAKEVPKDAPMPPPGESVESMQPPA